MAKIVDFISDYSDKTKETKITDTEISTVTGLKNAYNETEIKKLQEANKHEQEMVKYGWFGKVFGAEENSSKAITFTVIAIILLFWVAICVISIFHSEVKDIFIDTFKVITPIITLAFGYLFGKK